MQENVSYPSSSEKQYKQVVFQSYIGLWSSYFVDLNDENNFIDAVSDAKTLKACLKAANKSRPKDGQVMYTYMERFVI